MATTTTNPSTLAFPPHQHLRPASPISASTALAHIQAYLVASTTTPYLHPDCIFVERQGPAFAGNASVGGVTLHQLRRVEAGLRGVWMGAEVFGDAEVEVDGEGEGVGEEEGDGEMPEGDDSRLDEVIEEHEQRRGRRWSASKREVQEDEEGWGNYQEQLGRQGERLLQGEIGDRSNAVRNRKEVPRVASTVEGKRRRTEGGTEVRESEKDARKRAKKERAKGEKVQRASERFERRGNSVEATENGVEGSAVGGDAYEGKEEESMLVPMDGERVQKAERRRKRRERKEGKASRGGEDESKMDMNGDGESPVEVGQQPGERESRKPGDAVSPPSEEQERAKRKADRRAQKEERKRRQGVV